MKKDFFQEWTEMKKDRLFYIIYLLLVISITVYFSMRIIKGEMSFPFFLSNFVNFIRKSMNKPAPFSYDEKLFVHMADDWASLPEERKNMKRLSNSEGFKDYEYRIEKPNNTFRIIALGDSMTEGVFVAVNDTWPKQLERKLNKLNLTLQFEVFNFSIAGAGTLEEVKTLEEKGLKYNPDMVILAFFGNDWEDSVWIKNRTKELWKGYKNGSFKLPEEVEKKFEEVKVTEKNIPLLIAYLAISEYWDKAEQEGMLNVWNKNVERPLSHLIELCKEKNISLIVTALEIWDIDSTHEKELLTELFSEHDIPFLDLTDILWAHPKSEIKLADGHLNEYGYNIVSNKIMEFILQNFDFNK